MIEIWMETSLSKVAVIAALWFYNVSDSFLQGLTNSVSVHLVSVTLVHGWLRISIGGRQIALVTLHTIFSVGATAYTFFFIKTFKI